MFLHPIQTQDHIYAWSSHNYGTDRNIYPLKKDLLRGNNKKLVYIVPPGEFTSIGFFLATSGMLWILTACEMNVCEAPESNKTVAGIELMLNVPIIISGPSWTVSVATLFTVAAEAVDFWLLFCLLNFSGQSYDICPFFPQWKHLVEVLGALLFMEVVFKFPKRGVCWPFWCWLGLHWCWLILETLRLLVAVPLTDWSLKPLLIALLRTETLTVVAPRTLC